MQKLQDTCTNYRVISRVTHPNWSLWHDDSQSSDHCYDPQYHRVFLYFSYNPTLNMKLAPSFEVPMIKDAPYDACKHAPIYKPRPRFWAFKEAKREWGLYTEKYGDILMKVYQNPEVEIILERELQAALCCNTKALLLKPPIASTSSRRYLYATHVPININIFFHKKKRKPLFTTVTSPTTQHQNPELCVVRRDIVPLHQRSFHSTYFQRYPDAQHPGTNSM